MTRYRLVTTLNEGAPHVSSVVLSKAEAAEQLATEALLHTLGGWKVSASEGSITCTKGAFTRTIIARESDAFHDPVKGEQSVSSC